MPRRSASLLRWTLTLLLTLVLALEIASVWWTFHWQRGLTSAPGEMRITVERGKWEILWRGTGPPQIIGNPAFFYPPGLSVRRVNDPSWGIDDPGLDLRRRKPPPFTWTACEFKPARYGWSSGTINFPLTYAILALALPTGWLWLGEIRRRKKIRAGCCRSCGYDLRGLERVKTDEEGGQMRCPECGKPAATA